MQLIWFLPFIFSTAFGLWGDKTPNGPIQTLITPSLFSKISPNLQNAITVQIIQDQIYVPPKMIRLMFSNISEMHVASCKITCVEWNPASGLLYDQNNFGFIASLNYSLVIKYTTKSRFIPSATINVAVRDSYYRMKMGFQQQLESIDPRIDLVNERFGKIKMAIPMMRLQIVKSAISSIVKKTVHPFIKKNIMGALNGTMEGILSGVRKLDENTILRKELFKVPRFTEDGILFDFDFLMIKHLFLLEKRWWNPFKSKSKRIAPIVAPGTDLQTWLTVDSIPGFFEPLMVNISSYLKRIDFGDEFYPLKFNINRNSSVYLGNFMMKQEKVHWSKSSKMEFANDLILLDLVFSFSGVSKYVSSDEGILPSGTFVGSIGNFKIASIIKLDLENDNLISTVNVTGVNMDSFQDLSATKSIALSQIYKEALENTLLEIISDALEINIPNFFTSTLRPSISVPLIGELETRFIQAPLINTFGIFGEVVLDGENIEESDVVYDDWICFRGAIQKKLDEYRIGDKAQVMILKERVDDAVRFAHMQMKEESLGKGKRKYDDSQDGKSKKKVHGKKY